MQTSRLVITLVLAVCAFQCGELKAQTCPSPLPFISPEDLPVTTGNTCDSADSVQYFCGGQSSVGKPDDVYQLNLGASNRTFTQLSVSGATGGSASFHPVVYIYSGDCATGEGCLVVADEASSPVDTSASVLPAGHYFLVVSASPSDPPGSCGDYTLQANGVLPIQLQSFSVD